MVALLRRIGGAISLFHAELVALQRRVGGAFHAELVALYI